MDLWDTDQPATTLNGTAYEEYIFYDRITRIIQNQDPADPLFLFYAPHIAHCPLQVRTYVLWCAVVCCVLLLCYSLLCST